VDYTLARRRHAERGCLGRNIVCTWTGNQAAPGIKRPVLAPVYTNRGDARFRRRAVILEGDAVAVFLAPHFLLHAIVEQTGRDLPLRCHRQPQRERLRTAELISCHEPGEKAAHAGNRNIDRKRLRSNIRNVPHSKAGPMRSQP
jgi:hypothetical protein